MGQASFSLLNLEEKKFGEKICCRNFLRIYRLGGGLEELLDQLWSQLEAQVNFCLAGRLSTKLTTLSDWTQFIEIVFL